MDHQMDYIYHSAEQSPNHSHAQQSACPYMRGENNQNGPPMLSPLRPSSHYDPVHSSTHPWYTHHHSQQYQWPPASGPSSQPPHYHRSTHSASDPFHFNPSPVPPQPPAMSGYQGNSAQEFNYPMPPYPPFHQNNRFGGHQPANQPIMSGQQNQNNFTNERPWGAPTTPRANNFSPTTAPPGPTLGQTEPAENSEEPATSEAAQDRPAATAAPENSAPQNQASIHAIQFGSAAPSSSSHRRERAPFSMIAHGYSSLRDNVSPPALSSSPSTNPPPVASQSERRRVVPGRNRRAISRIYSPPMMDRGDSDDEFQSALLDHFLTGSRLAPTEMDETHLRAAQFLRGSVSTKMVASASAISSLQSVPLAELSENERTCVICYNDFGVETPEGVNEAPLRLPKCKHVFGDHCIKKWFEESDSCPYCRDKVPSEPRMHSRHRALANMMRRGAPQFGGLQSEELYMRILAGRGSEESSVSGAASGQWQAGRRSPPSDGGEPRRRMRPRHGNARGSGSPPASGTRPNSIGGTSTLNQQQSPSRERGPLIPAFHASWMGSGPRRSITPAISRPYVTAPGQRASGPTMLGPGSHPPGIRHPMDQAYSEDATSSADSTPPSLPPMYGAGSRPPMEVSFPNPLNHRGHHPHSSPHYGHWPTWSSPHSTMPPPPQELPPHLRNQPHQGWSQ